MKNTNWKDIVELTGIAAVVASLIFVGLQMKQSHEIALAEIYQARTTMLVDWDNDMASNTLAMTAFIKSENGQNEEIEPIERWAAWYKAAGDIMMIENSHYQYTLGYLPEEHWGRVRRNLKRLVRDPLYGPIIDQTKYNMRDAFRAVVEEIELELASDTDA